MKVEYSYCVQCRETKSGKIGDFIHKGDKVAISPVFDNLADLFKWMRPMGFAHANYTSSGFHPFRLERDE